jgi:PUA domain protein
MKISKEKYKMAQRQLSKSDIKELNNKISKYGLNLSKKDKVELIDNIYFVNDKPCLLVLDKMIIPTLKLILSIMEGNEGLSIKKVTVDMGAIKFLINGADVMRPGITNIEEGFDEKDIVIIIDENNKKPISIGQALLDSQEMEKSQGGKVIKNLHYVGDLIWKK